MKRTTILVCTLAAGMAWAQNPQIIQKTRDRMNSVQQKTTAASNQALGIKPEAAKTSSATTSSVKTAAKPVKPIAVKTAAVPAPAKSAKVAVAPAKAAVTPAKASSSPAQAKIVPAKAATSAPVPKVATVTKTAAAKSVKSTEPFAPKKVASASAAPKLGVKTPKAKTEAKKVATKKADAATKTPAPASSANNSDSAAVSSEEGKGDDDAVKEAQDKKWAMSGKRDPFISPVVSRAGGSGCSTGKKCLEIGAINLRGVVHSDGGFIAVVTNNLNKAYFLRENDPVFDGYVVKITGDSIVFKATMQDRLGKTFTREVTKKITTPAV
jgi:hypothetical protein